MIYFDHNATTPPAPETVEAVRRCLAESWGNPSSLHAAGQAARVVREDARRAVAALVGAPPDGVTFTSGATEAACQLLLGLALRPGARPRHLVVSALEHPCVLEPARALEELGWSVTRVGADATGRIAPQAVAEALRPETALVSVMLANHDTGVLQPVREVVALAHARGVPVHTDAVQAVGRIPVDLASLGADYLTLSAHKFYGPKGVGALVTREPAAAPPPLLLGGAQERARRAGTENLPGIAGLGAAARLAAARLAADAARVGALRDRLEAGLLAAFPAARVNGAGAPRLPNTLNVAFPGLDAVAAVMNLDLAGVAVATTSACATARREPPHVLVAMGLPPELARASLRFSLGRGNTEEEVVGALAVLADLLPQVRA